MVKTGRSGPGSRKERISAMRRVFGLFLLLLLLSACAAPAEEEKTPDSPPQTVPEAPPEEEAPEEEAPEEAAGETVPPEDRVLLTLEAPLADGRTLRLEAVGRVEDEYSCGVREVRVYDEDALLQTITAYDAIEWEWGSAADDLAGAYTNCWKPEETMEALDLNFDGNTDFGLFGWICNNTIPYYYWLWDEAAGVYRYAFSLQGAEAHPETGEVTSEYKSGDAGSQWITRYYKPDAGGALVFDRLERLVYNFTPDSGMLDADREGAREIWVTPEGKAPERLGPGGGMEAVSARNWGAGSLEDYMTLIYREVPVEEINADNTFSYFTEIWELKDGQFQMTSREEYFYENQP